MKNVLIIFSFLAIVSCGKDKKNIKSENIISVSETVNNLEITTEVLQLDDNLSIEYFSQGNGEVIVLFSGRGLTVGYLEPLATKLAESGYRTIRINRRGAGKSIGLYEGIDYHTHAADAKKVLEKLNIKSASIMGHALGGRIARVFASDFPTIASNVILIPASGKVAGDPEEAKITGKMFTPNATHEEIMAGMQFMVGNPTNSERVWEVIASSKLTNPEALKSEATLYNPIEEWWAPNGDTPYLVVQGLKDKNAPPENATLLKKDLGDRMTLVELPEAGHLSTVEFPTEVAEAITNYLKN